MSEQSLKEGALSAQPLRPGMPAPPLAVQTGGALWTLAERRPERFTMVVFYRGHHCPVCRTYLRDLNRRIDDFAARGVDAIAVSGDDEERARRTREEWDLDRLTVGYGQSIASMREWGLFISHAIKPPEPETFAEPGLFLVRQDGTVYAIVLNSMPFGRPSFADILSTLDFIIARDYPARGEA